MRDKKKGLKLRDIVTKKRGQNIFLILRLTLQTIDKNGIRNYNKFVDFDGVSPSGKATDSDSVIRRFESCYPCQMTH